MLGYILLYWCIFYCTGKYTHIANEYVCVLRYRMQLYNIDLCIAVVGHRNDDYDQQYCPQGMHGISIVSYLTVR